MSGQRGKLCGDFRTICEGDTANPLTGTIFFGVPPPTLSPQSPSISSVTYNAKKGKITVRGKNFNSQCTLLIDGHQWEIYPNGKDEKLGPVMKAVGLTLSPGTHEVQVGDVNGDLSLTFQLSVGQSKD